MNSRSAILLRSLTVGLLVLAPALPVSAGEQTEVHGFVDASYFAEPPLGTDTFGLDQAEVDITHVVGERGGLRADLEWVKNGDMWEVAVEQGYLEYRPPLEADLTFTFGRFNAPIGFELLDAPDMYQFSHGLVFDYGLPSNLTGLMAATRLGERVDLLGYVVDGWDSNDLGRAGPKTFGGRAGYSFGEKGGVGLSAISGQELREDETSSVEFDRTVLDLDFTFTPVEGLLIGGEFNRGIVDVQGTDADWTGVLAMVHYDFNAWFGLTGRYDWLDDPDDFVFASGFMETRQAFTIAPTFVLGDGMGALVELRVDTSSEEVFLDSDGEPQKSTTTVAFEMTYTY